MDGPPFSELFKYYNAAQDVILKLRNRLGAELERYSLLEGGIYTPLAEFKQGSTFVPDAHPHGTPNKGYL